MDHGDFVADVHRRFPPERTVDGALAFLLRLIGALQAEFPWERVGLLIKTAGENIAPYAGTSVSAGRICYPDLDLLVKVLSDVPTTNGPSWATDEGIPNEGHHGGFLAVIGDVPVPDVPEPDDEPAPTPVLVDLTPVLAAIREHDKLIAELTAQIGTLNKLAEKLDTEGVKKPLPEYLATARVLGFNIPIISRPR